MAYEKLNAAALAPPWQADLAVQHPADYNIIAARLGWLPFYPQFDRSPLQLCKDARDHGAHDSGEIFAYIVEKLKNGSIKFAAEDPNNPVNSPVMFFWRANVLGASNKGHEYFLRHLLGADDTVLDEENQAMRPQEMVVREADPKGKLDLLVILELRMNTSALYSDVVLPAATWYEFDDLNTTDLHPFSIRLLPPLIHPGKPSPTGISSRLSPLNFLTWPPPHLGVQEDVVAKPLHHDSMEEIAQPLGRAQDWKKGEIEPTPEKTMPQLKYSSEIFPLQKMTALGPLVAETNGRVAVKGWRNLEEKTGLNLVQLSAGLEGERYTFNDVVARPRREISSPVWTGVHSDIQTYAPFVINIENLVPFRTLTGRAQFYLNHEWILAFGEGLPIFRPPLDLQGLGYAQTRVPSRPGKY